MLKRRREVKKEKRRKEAFWFLTLVAVIVLLFSWSTVSSFSLFLILQILPTVISRAVLCSSHCALWGWQELWNCLVSWNVSGGDLTSQHDLSKPVCNPLCSLWCGAVIKKAGSRWSLSILGSWASAVSTAPCHVVVDRCCERWGDFWGLHHWDTGVINLAYP
jgi:hypothetical protein